MGDEYIISVRYRALTITVLLFFIIRVISEMMYGSLHNMVFHPMFVGYAFEGQFFGAVAFRKTLNVIHVLGSTNVLMFLYIILLKVLVRNGSGNGYKSILLPNSYKRIGWYIFMGSLVFIPLFIYLFCHIWNGHLSVYQVYETHLTLFRLLILIPYVGLLFICLSKEKQEDELIRHIRVRVMVSFAIFYLIIGVLSSFANIAMEVYKLYPHDNEAYFFMIAVLLLRVVLWFPLVSVVYALVLRKVLSNNLKVLLGIGNSLFHVWGGKETAVRTGNDIRALGVFVSTGAFGLAVGSVFLSRALMLCLLISICILALAYLLIDTARPIDTTETDSESKAYPKILVWAVLILIMLIVAGRSFLGESFSGVIDKTPVVVLLVGALTMTGKMAGGWLVKWMGMVTSVILLVAGVIVCLVAKGNHIGIALAGLFMVNCTMPITLYWANVMLKGREGLAFGLLAASLIPGYLIATLLN